MTENFEKYNKFIYHYCEWWPEVGRECTIIVDYEL